MTDASPSASTPGARPSPAGDDAARFDPAVFARLARLELSPEERDRYAREFGVLLDAFGVISKVNTDGVEPMVYPIAQAHRARPDEARPCDGAASLLANAPGSGGGEFFRVPKVLEA
jgi:aspartyl-tRNA(Asn)/glutamyl-tRNA(Gln) amidotransferase subunit C